MSTASFRDFVPPRSRFDGKRDMSPQEWTDFVLANKPAARVLFEGGKCLLAAPFRGVSADGTPDPALFARADEGAPVAAMVAAAERLLHHATPDQRAAFHHDIASDIWRQWANPELYVFRVGVRLEEHPQALRDAVLEVVRASLSEAGYAKVRGIMRTNAFLGTLVDLPKILGEYSYNFNLFGTPSQTRPWGWHLFGHHLALNCFVYGSQMVLTPSFLGSEPNFIDEGPHAGPNPFADEERIGLDLMRSLPGPVRERARIYEALHDAAMPEGRWHPADHQVLGGCFQDNRVVPFEGVRAGDLDVMQCATIMRLFEAYLTILPSGPRAARLAALEQQLDRTWFSWIGGYGDDDPFYYRLQSPLVMIEFDHHSGVFLTNAEPAKFHTHTVIRTPNGNDYGKALADQ